MVRGTTPTFIFNTPVDLTQAISVYVTFSEMDDDVILTKTGTDLDITAESVSVFLTQEETLSFPNGKVKVQLNWLYADGSRVKRACSNQKTIIAADNLIDEVIE